MGKMVADFLLERLREWGVRRIYGYPGDGINGIVEAMNRAGNDPELIHVRHEEMSAFRLKCHEHPSHNSGRRQRPQPGRC